MKQRRDRNGLNRIVLNEDDDGSQRTHAHITKAIVNDVAMMEFDRSTLEMLAEI